MTDEQPEEPLSGKIRKRIEDQEFARLKNDPKHSGKRATNIMNLDIACSAILDGSAHALSIELGFKRALFARRILTPSKIHDYCKMKKWDGPHRTTLYADADFRDYVDARRSEAVQVRAKTAERKLRPSLEEIISKLDILDQSILRAELSRGRNAKAEHTALQAWVASSLSFTVDQLAGDLSKLRVPGDQPLSVDQRSVLNGMYGRITDARFLKSFYLVYDGNFLKLDHGAEQHLIYSEEMRLLRELAGRQN